MYVIIQKKIFNMKHFVKHLQSLVTVALCVIMAFTFTSCNKNEDEPAADNLSSIIVGVWAQDGDDDIMVFNANGTGMFYDSPADYAHKESSYNFTWNLKNEWLTINIDYYGDGSYDYQEKCRPEKIVSKNKIIWKDYDEDFAHDGLNDAFGYYRLWTWERYPD